MKLHAGSLYRNYLILRDAPDDLFRCIQVNNEAVQWEIYCNDVEFKALNETSALVTYDGHEYEFPYFVTSSPTKALGFGQ